MCTSCDGRQRRCKYCGKLCNPNEFTCVDIGGFIDVCNECSPKPQENK